jgi:hypothetical protein
MRRLREFVVKITVRVLPACGRKCTRLLSVSTRQLIICNNSLIVVLDPWGDLVEVEEDFQDSRSLQLAVPDPAGLAVPVDRNRQQLRPSSDQ